MVLDFQWSKDKKEAKLDLIYNHLVSFTAKPKLTNESIEGTKWFTISGLLSLK